MWIGFIYLLFAAAIVAYEFSRKKRIFYDQLSLINLLFLANIVFPAAILHLVLDVGYQQGADTVAGFSLLGYMYHRAQPTERIILLLGCLLAYGGLVIGYKLSTRGVSFANQTRVGVNPKLCLAWVVIGWIFFALMFVFGNSLVPGDPIQGLLLSTYYRAEDPFYAFERTPLNANIYASTSTFLLISVAGVALAAERRWSRFLYLVMTLIFVFIDVVASGARRNLLVAALLVYLYSSVRKAKHNILYVLAILVLAAPLLHFGKAVLRNLSSEDLPEKLALYSASASVQAVTAAAELGVSYVESIGTLALYKEGPRCGIDHAFSVLRMIPLGLMGFEKPWPERIVRVSTEYQSGDPTMQDIPPGYLGQCWIDFPFLGFILMPFLHGICFGIVERIFRFVDVRRSPFYLVAYLVAGFIVAMPLNSGTLDYICCPEIVLTVMLFMFLHFLNTRRFGLAGLGRKTTRPAERRRFEQSTLPANAAVQSKSLIPERVTPYNGAST